MSCRQLTVELEPAREELVGVCFIIPASKDQYCDRYGHQKKYVGRSPPKPTTQSNFW